MLSLPHGPTGGIIPWDRILEARSFLERYLEPTALLRARGLDSVPGGPAFLKLECQLPTGSFKVRGALYALWVRHRDAPVSSVIASSTGNHGLATAYAGKELGIPAKIFVPRGSNPAKCEGIRMLGASLSETGLDLTEARQAAAEHARQMGGFVLDDATDPNLPAGPATIALEILDAMPDVARLVVPVGDTALIRGVAAAAKTRRPDIQVIGVQAEVAPAYTLSWRAGSPVSTATCDTIADGLATRTTDPVNVAAIRALVDDFVLVSEQELLDAVRQLYVEDDVVAEPAGAAALAAFKKLAPVAPAAAGPTALLVTGGNVSPELWELVQAR